jgi:hypothetical protein
MMREMALRATRQDEFLDFPKLLCVAGKSTSASSQSARVVAGISE